MRVIMMGGCQVGASAAYVKTRDANGLDRRILIDSGAKMGNVEIQNAGHIMPEEGVDMVIVTHGHRDHVGHLWAVLYKYPEAVVKMTRPTTYITQINWDDSFKILKNRVKKHKRYYPVLDQVSKGIENAANNLSIIEEPGRQEIFPGIFSTFQAAGHLQGATWIMIEAEGQTVLFSGDINFQDTPTVNGARMDEMPTGQIDALFMDSTYGAKEASLRQDEWARMARRTKEALKENRSVVVASLSLGRLPDIAVDYAEAGIDVFVDGLGRTTLLEALGLDAQWSKHERTVEYKLEEPAEDNGGFRSVRIGTAWIKMIDEDRQREVLLNSSQPKVILAPSGMLSGGYSVRYFARFLEDPRALLFLTSYQAEETAGASLLRKEKGDYLSLLGPREETIRVKINAEVHQVNLSSHPGASDVFNLLRCINPTRTFLVHGGDSQRVELRTFLEEKGRENIFIPQVGDTIDFN